MNTNARTFLWGVIAVLIAALVIVGLAAVLVGADNTTVIRKAQQESSESLRLIRSCTTPGMECFDESQKRTANVVADINKVAVYAAACADKHGVQGSDEIYACVVRALAKADEEDQ